MAIIKKNELVQMDEKTLNGKLTELKMELIKINAQISMGTLPENPGRIKEIRKTIARIKTLKNMKEGGKLA
jgi:large subunit ribosomal protein L29|tara:strand:+ start:1317 stop:1529 length:213 start_codon:yes stop_codon:yes gene_type:complete